MTRPGRLLRAQMRPDPPSAVAERVAYRAVCDQVWAEVTERWPVIDTIETARDAIAYQERRIRELTRST